MANAHENIDNEIAIDTIKRIMHASSGNWMEGLFEAITKGPKREKRYIHRTQPRYPNKEAWQDMTNNLYRAVTENPSFADTLTQKELPGIKEGLRDLDRPNILIRLIDKLFGNK